MTAIEFNQHVLSFSDKLKYFALSLTADRDDADDLFQETYLRAFKYREKMTDYRNVKAWIYTIMRNIFINEYRRKFKSSASVTYTDDPYQLDLHNEKYKVSGDVEFSVKEIEKVINELDEEYRIPFMMHVEGYKYKEIAEENNLMIGTVKSRIFNARQKLMDSLADFRL